MKTFVEAMGYILHMCFRFCMGCLQVASGCKSLDQICPVNLPMSKVTSLDWQMEEVHIGKINSHSIPWWDL